MAEGVFSPDVIFIDWLDFDAIGEGSNTGGGEFGKGICLCCEGVGAGPEDA